MSADLEAHPVASLFPMLPADELAELAADIRERGQLQPIILDGEGRILDGRNRYAACQMADVEPRFETYEGADPDGYALAVNVARRHLRPGQRYLITEKARRLIGTRKSYISESATERVSLSEAAVVLDFAPELAEMVMTSTMSLATAAETARERKKAAREAEEQRNQLKAQAPDLCALVDDGDLEFIDAFAALSARQEKARAEAAERADEKARLEHERSVERARDIETAKSAAAEIVTRIQADVSSIVIGARHGEKRLIDKDMVAQIREAIELLEGLL